MKKPPRRITDDQFVQLHKQRTRWLRLFKAGLPYEPLAVWPEGNEIPRDVVVEATRDMVIKETGKRYTKGTRLLAVVYGAQVMLRTDQHQLYEVSRKNLKLLGLPIVPKDDDKKPVAASLIIKPS